MKPIQQEFDVIIESLSPLEADWMDGMAEEIMARIEALPMKSEYDRSDIAKLIEANDASGFTVSRFCVGLFLGYSKDKLESELSERLGKGGIGIKRFQSDREGYLDVLEELGVESRKVVHAARV